MARVVLVTGVSRGLAARVARTLAAPGDLTVVGVDVTPPRYDLGAATFVRADIRSPVIAKVVSGRGVDTVVHMAVVSAPAAAGGRASMKEINVIGTMQLLAACQQADGFAKLVVQSSGSVYGASPRDPARFTEDMAAKVAPRDGYGKDAVEIEGYVRGLARRRPDVVVTTLRLGSLVGAGADGLLTRYLSLPVVPRVAGFDARFQLLHPDDAVTALELVTRRDVPGTFNVAAEDVVTLGQAVRRTGRLAAPVPQPAAPLVARVSRRARLADITADQVAALTYGRGLDVTRFRAATGFTPRYSSRQALDDFAAAGAPGPLDPDRLGAALDPDRLRRGLDRVLGRGDTTRG
ncbi:NAD-dependent epimerase/dehydratase family protein [Microlunatus capsulatus]|uniref:UDP-glucose 4-epimerase n=1 Tax=Microlunatus capsulatus TaxID=99117 RepID=A0ABS4Z9R0_9ACTN|nr:NAD-dependent epimerase/dehydratase family protein [Microlunatus capsulatus]MBP2417775.1 UDP-glucose 4-epimerase [Microlunatus capsulatus]